MSKLDACYRLKSGFYLFGLFANIFRRRQNMKKFSLVTLTIFSLSAASFVSAEKIQNTSHSAHAAIQSLDKEEPIRKAVAQVRSTATGEHVLGYATFTEEGKGVKVVVNAANLKPGDHGIHIHKFGDCSSEGKAAGDHYNPTNVSHGAPGKAEHHRGDLGNLSADASGKAHLEGMLEDAKLHFLIGRSVIIHADADDLKTQPSGNSGARVGCGIIGIVEENKAESSSATTKRA